jgi:hypothetical protein
VVERSFARLARLRRLARDHERLAEPLAGWHRELTREEVDCLFRQLVEDAGPFEGAEDPPVYPDGPSNEADR